MLYTPRRDVSSDSEDDAFWGTPTTSLEAKIVRDSELERDRGRGFHFAGRRSGLPNTRLGNDEDEMPVTRRRDTSRPRK